MDFISTKLVPQTIQLIDDEDLLSVDEISDLLNRSNETVRRWIRKGELTPLTVGRYQIEGRELKRFLLCKLKKHL